MATDVRPDRAGNEKAGIRDPAIQVIDVEKRFGAQVVLKKVSMEVQEGQVAALIGPSGSLLSNSTRAIYSSFRHMPNSMRNQLSSADDLRPIMNERN